MLGTTSYIIRFRLSSVCLSSLSYGVSSEQSAMLVWAEMSSFWEMSRLCYGGAVSSWLWWCGQKWAVMGNEQFKLLLLSTWYFFLVGWVEGIILRHLYQRHFFVKALLHGQKLGVEQSGMLVWAVGYVGGPCDFSVSPSPFGLDFGTLDFGLGLDNKSNVCYNLEKGREQLAG